MRFSLYKTLWGAVGAGAPHATFADAMPVIAAEGWDGVAFALIAHEFDAGLGTTEELADLCAQHDLGLAIMLHTFGETPRDHLADLESGLKSLASLHPHHVICHGGLDSFSHDQGVEFLSEAIAVADGLGIRVGHETHRGRILHSPWVTQRMLAEVPGLELVVDLSHWVVVAERLIDEFGDVIAACGSNAIHVDARVGHEQGPQVSDPEESRWSTHTEAFHRWWAALWSAASDAGRDELVFVPEYGPAPYQPIDSAMIDPGADLWDVSRRAGQRLRDHFSPLSRI
jgi:hypothetical protein